jgi:hypothetical protein
MKLSNQVAKLVELFNIIPIDLDLIYKLLRINMTFERNRVVNPKSNSKAYQNKICEILIN